MDAVLQQQLFQTLLLQQQPALLQQPPPPPQNDQLASYQSVLAQLQQQSPDPLLAGVASNAQSGAYSQALAQLQQQQQLGQQLQAALTTPQAIPAQTVATEKEFFSFDSASFGTVVPAVGSTMGSALASTPAGSGASGAFFAFDSFDAPKEPAARPQAPQPAAIPLVSRPSITIAPVVTRPPLPVHPGSERQAIATDEAKEPTKAKTQKTNALVTTIAKERSRSRSEKVKKKIRKASSSSSDVKKRQKKDKKDDKKRTDKKESKKKKEKKARSPTPKAPPEKETKASKSSKKEAKETKKKAEMEQPPLPPADQPPAPPPGAPLKPLPSDEIWKQSAPPKLEEPKPVVNPIMAQFMAQQKAAQDQAAKLKEQEESFRAKQESFEAKRKAAEEEDRLRLEAQCKAIAERAEADIRSKREKEEAELRAMQEVLVQNEREKEEMKATQRALLEALSQADTALHKQKSQEPASASCSSSEEGEKREKAAKRKHKRDDTEEAAHKSKKSHAQTEKRRDSARSKSRKKNRSRSHSSRSKARRKKSRDRDRRDKTRHSRKSQERKKSCDRDRSRGRRDRSRSRDRKHHAKDRDRKKTGSEDGVFGKERRIAFNMASKESSARAAQEIEERLMKQSRLEKAPPPPPPPIELPPQNQSVLMQKVQKMRHQLQSIQEREVLHPQQLQMLQQLRMLEQQGVVQPHQAGVVEQWDGYMSDYLARRELQQQQMEEQRRQHERQQIFQNQEQLRRQVAESQIDHANSLKDHIAMANSASVAMSVVAFSEQGMLADIGGSNERHPFAEPKAMPSKGSMWARKGGKGKLASSSLDDELAVPKAMPTKGKHNGKACGKNRDAAAPLVRADAMCPTQAPSDGHSALSSSREGHINDQSDCWSTSNDKDKLGGNDDSWGDLSDIGDNWGWSSWEADSKWGMAWDTVDYSASEGNPADNVGSGNEVHGFMKPVTKQKPRPPWRVSAAQPHDLPDDLLSMPAGVTESGTILPFWGQEKITREDESDEEEANWAKEYDEDYDEDDRWWGKWVQHNEGDDAAEKQWTPEEWKQWEEEQEDQYNEERKQQELKAAQDEKLKEEKNAEEAQAQDEAPPKCPKGHLLKKQYVRQGGRICCDGCGRTAPKRSNVFRCQRCDYDLCERCVSKDDIGGNGKGKKGKGKGKKRKERKEQYGKRRGYDEAPDKFDDEHWEEPRKDSGLLLISDLAPSMKWEYVVTDENRRSYAAFLPCPFEKSQCDDFFDEIKNGTDWFQPTGKWGPAPRQTAWMVKRGCECQYQYGDTNVDPQEYPPWMIALLKKVMPMCGIHSEEEWPDSCNMNLYEDGNMSVGWHADDERLFQGKFRDIAIISLSLGQKRKFQMRLNFPEDHEPKEQTIYLGDGDLMSMEGMFQKHYQHRVPKEDGLEPRPRINLTWRWVLMHTTKCPSQRCRH